MSHTVIGMVRDVRWHGWDIESPMIYGPYARLTTSPFQTYFIHTARNPSATIREVVNAVIEHDPTMRPRTAATLEEMYLSSVSMRRFQSWLFGGFAAAALLVVAVGILGLLAMSAARRTREVGIRCALGATPASVTTLIVREQVGAVVTGLVAGALVAAWAVGLVEGYLYQLTPADPRIWAAAVALILTTAAVGTLVPAIRAGRTDPLAALRAE
jgi:predicted lysophospholipase L1 biosynthesis ABC-type transport system permease subunit